MEAAIITGNSLGHYEILEKLGAGGMGDVYRAHDSKLNRNVALKVLPAELAADPERLARFEREAKAVAAIDHPNIVTIYSVEEAAPQGPSDASSQAADEAGDSGEVGAVGNESVHFITMQLVEGTTLSDLIPHQRIALEEFFELAIPLADAVSAAHEHGIVHRDLKPDNVMVSKHRRVKVLHFGLAKLGGHDAGVLRIEGDVGAATELQTSLDSEPAAAPLTEKGTILGTVAYMSPQQAEGGSMDRKTDNGDMAYGI